MWARLKNWFALKRKKAGPQPSQTPQADQVEDAVQRELRAGVARKDVYLAQDSRLRSSKNPEGIAVANVRDEPLGIAQGLERAKQEGKDPRNYGGGDIPNFAGGGMPPYLQNLGSGARNLADAALGADRVNKALGSAAKAGTALKVAFADLLSPLGLAAGFALTFSIGLYKAVMNSRLLQAALERTAQVQLYSVQFDKLLGGMRQAKQRLNELSAMSARGPFKFDDLVDGNRRMQVLTRGAMSGKQSMKLLQDAAAASGTSVSQMAAVVGSAYDDTFSGRSIEGSINQLREFGTISSATADRLINLERAGVRGKKLFNELEAALAQNAGSAEKFRNTLEGLNNELESAKGDQLQGIGEMFAQGKMDGLRAAINLVKEFGPVLNELLMPFAALANAIAKFTLMLSNAVTAIPGIKSALTGLAQAAGAALAALSALAAVQTINALRALLIPLLARLTTGMLASAAAGGVLGRALGFITGGILRFLGPIGLVLALLDLFGFKFETVARSAGLLPDSVKEAAESSRKASKDIQDALNALSKGGSPGEAIDLVNKAEENFRNAQKAQQEAAASKPGEVQQAVGRAAGVVLGLPVDALAGVANAGAQMMGMPSPFKTAMDPSGEMTPFGGSAMLTDLFTGESAQKTREEQAAAAAAEAKRQRDEARKAVAKTPAQYLNDPDFKAAQQEAMAMMNEANRMQDALDAKKNVPEEDRARQQEAIDKMRSEAQTKMSPDALEQKFNQRMARDEVKASLARSMADGTGNEALRQRANALEDQIKTERRSKELQKIGIERPEAMKMAQAQTLSERLQSEQDRSQNMMFASGLAKVGGAAGEMGGGKSEEARLLTEIRNLMERDMGGKTPPPLPENMTKLQR